jgi:alkaline phosphatase
MKKIVFYLASIVILAFNTSFKTDEEVVNNNSEHAKNVILMIGDGMGLAEIYASYTVNKGFLNILSLPVTGLSKTNSADNYITDSAAGGTALSTGQKTKNGQIAVDTGGKRLNTILEIAEKNGLSSGIAVTSSVTHATPASFYAHVTSRKSQEDIAVDLLKSEIDVVIGGGKKFFMNRSDKRDLVSELKKENYSVAFNLADTEQIKSEKLVVLAADDSMPNMALGRGDFLPKAVDDAIKILSKNTKGFFLMVEGSQIDWGGHRRNIKMVTSEAIDFDKAVGVALDFAKSMEIL